MISLQASNFSIQLVFLPPNSLNVALLFQSLYVTYSGNLYYTHRTIKKFLFLFFYATHFELERLKGKPDGQKGIKKMKCSMRRRFKHEFTSVNAIKSSTMNEKED